MKSMQSGLKFLFFVFLLALFMSSLSVMAGERSRFNADKLVAFECGFDPMSSSRSPFSFRFFLLALLFLVFDVEIILLVSYCYSLKMVFLSIPVLSAGLCFVFLLILIFGLIQEANEGALMW